MYTLLLIPIAAGIGFLIAKTVSAPTSKDAPLPSTQAPTPAPIPLAAGTVINQTVDGKGTGLIPGNINQTVDGKGTGIIPEPTASAAAQAANIVASQQNPAAAAAEVIKLQIAEALNTPEGDRTPEQLALLIGLGSLPNT